MAPKIMKYRRIWREVAAGGSVKRLGVEIGSARRKALAASGARAREMASAAEISSRVDANGGISSVLRLCKSKY
jgi:hypothetical protein